MSQYYRNLQCTLNNEYIDKIKEEVKLTYKQRQAYKRLTTYRLSKEQDLYDNFSELFEDYFWILVATIKEDKIIEYVERYCI